MAAPEGKGKDEDEDEEEEAEKDTPAPLSPLFPTFPESLGFRGRVSCEGAVPDVPEVVFA